MHRRFRSAGPLIGACLLASCMRFGYDTTDELGDGLGLAGADGSGDSSADTSDTGGGTGGSFSSTASTDASGGTSGAGGATSAGNRADTGAGGTVTTGAGGASGAGATGADTGETSSTTSTSGAGSAGTGGVAGTDTGTGGSTSTDTSTGGAMATGGATTTGTGTGGGTTTVTAGSTTGGGAACAPAGTAEYVASFDADLEGFIVTGSGGLTWTGTEGNPDLGAMDLDASGGGAMQVKNLTPPGDLSGRIMSVNVYVESGANVDVMLYVQSGSLSKWADGGAVRAAAGQWYCLTLDLDDPVTRSVGFDPTDVRTVGVDIQGSGGVRAYIDQFAY